MSAQTKEKTFLAKRKWLNPIDHADTGMFSMDVSAESYGVSGTFTLWDCGRKVSLDFWVSDEKDAKARANKLDMLISGLQEMKEAMGKAYNFYLENKTDGVALDD